MSTKSDPGYADSVEEEVGSEKASSEIVLTGDEEQMKLMKQEAEDLKRALEESQADENIPQALEEPLKTAITGTPPITKKHEQKTLGPSETESMVPVWFCTNRKADPKGEYTKERDPDNNTYGRLDVTVEVAQNHNPSKKQGMEFKYVKKTEELFFKEINERLDTFRKLGCTPQVLVALHSYNVGFVDSLLAASHWQEDLNVAGACITFSWPSIGKSGNYEPDYAGIERSEPEILDFLVKLSASCGAEHVHLLADGMACLGLVRVLQRMATDQLDLKFGQIFLLAPDVDRDLFIDLSWLFPKYSTRTTLYASDCDRDAAKSAKRHSAPRAGLYEPYTIVDGADTVAISGLETDDLMFERKVRSYEIVTLFYDMYDLMKSDAPPSRRLHLSKQIDHGKTYWKLRKLMK